MTGDFITFLDSDDFWHHDYLKIMMGLQQQYDADIVQCKWIRGDQTIFPKISVTHEATCMSGYEAMANDIFDVIMCAKLYKKDMLDGIRMPVGLINEDDWTSWKICYRAKRFVSSQNKLYYYTFNQQSISAATSRVLDMGFFGAFEEKNNFFKTHKDDACTIWNLIKWNKSIILKYRIKGASKGQRHIMMQQFKKNFKELQKYPKFKLKTNIYFHTFMISPMILSELSGILINLMRNRKIRIYNKE